MITKKTFRTVILHYRKLLDGVLYQQYNEKLCRKLEEFLMSHKVQTMHGFLSIAKNKEPDISPLFNKIWSEGMQLMVPKTDFMFKQLRHYYLDANTRLVENKKGIPEPIDAEEGSFEEADLVLVPLLVSDQQGYRMGYGGGYYDKLLAETKALKVGLSLSPPVDEIMQRDDWDIPLDYLITPFKIYHYG